MGSVEPRGRHALKRLHEEAAEFNGEFCHVPGDLNDLADYLSRPRGSTEPTVFWDTELERGELVDLSVWNYFDILKET